MRRGCESPAALHPGPALVLPGELQRRFGNLNQVEVYRATLKKRVRERAQTLPQLAQDIELLVRQVYRAALEEIVVVLSRDHFTLQGQQLQIYPGDLRAALD